MADLPTESLVRQLISVMATHREDSYATQRKRFYELRAAARKIRERFGLEKWANLGAKHVAYLLERWKEEDQGRRTIEQKLSHFRWLLRKLGKPNLLPRENVDLGLKSGPRCTRAGRTISDPQFRVLVEAVECPRIRAMLLLARHLGLRFKEAALFRPAQDWQGDRVWVKRGTKGGRPRYLFLSNPRQAEALRMARDATGGAGGLIPQEVPTYEVWRQAVYRILRAAGLGRATDVTFHDLRRSYAVERMGSLIWERKLSWEKAARLVSRELGHHRTEVLDWYVQHQQARGDVPCPGDGGCQPEVLHGDPGRYCPRRRSIGWQRGDVLDGSPDDLNASLQVADLTVEDLGDRMQTAGSGVRG